MTAPLRIEDDDGVRLVTWARPDALNAMSIDLWDGTRDALRSAGDDGIGCIVVTGEGRAFTVGQDLAEMTDLRHADEHRGFRGVMNALADLDVPLVAAVNGLAVGFGTTLLPWCDIVLVSEAARFRVPFVALGVTCEAASSVTLAEVMGAHTAAEFVLTGAWLSADEAVAAGFGSRLLAADELLPAALGLARQIAAQPRAALRVTTRLLHAARREPRAAAMARENAEFATLAGGPENLAAIEAFFTR